MGKCSGIFYFISCLGRDGQEEFHQQKLSLTMFSQSLEVSSSICAKPANRKTNILGVQRPSACICPRRDLPPEQNCVNWYSCSIFGSSRVFFSEAPLDNYCNGSLKTACHAISSYGC